MIETIIETVVNTQNLAIGFTLVGVAATLLTIGLPMLERNELKSRMNSAVIEREKMRKRERAKLSEAQNRGVVREQKGIIGDIVAKLNLVERLSDQSVDDKLKMAGLRGGTPVVTYVFARVVSPIVLTLVAAFYLFIFEIIDQPNQIKLLLCLVAAVVGFFAPNIWLQNMISKRQKSISKAWPDSLDLMLICVESGMSIEAAFKKVCHEVGTQSPELAEELALTTAELSYLQDRRKAFENLALRTGLPDVKAVSTSLIQSEKYGTPVATALRVLAQESRDMRMTAAEKKAAALPPKLTVPMITFFLPVLFVVIMTPAIIEVMAVR